jgi:hypothetical protein
VLGLPAQRSRGGWCWSTVGLGGVGRPTSLAGRWARGRRPASRLGGESLAIGLTTMKPANMGINQMRRPKRGC